MSYSVTTEFELRGDTGRSDLIDVYDVPKFDLRFEVLGTLDEASSALGVVRASAASSETQDLILEIQHDLCWMMSELAVVADDILPLERRITPDRLAMLESAYKKSTVTHPLGESFVIPGDSSIGAFLHLARSIVRRAERYVILLAHQTTLSNPNIIPYLNRLSTLLYALARAEESEMGIREPTIARSLNNDG